MKFEKWPFKIEKQYRLRGWDYSEAGFYFVTICARDRLNLFRNVGTDPRVRSCFKQKGTIGQMNVAGEMVEKCWLKIPTKFNEIVLDKYVIMPNHVHGILVIKNSSNKGSELHDFDFGKKNLVFDEKERIFNLEKERTFYLKEQTRGSVPTQEQNTMFGHVGLLGQSIRWFKTMTTNEYIRNVKQNGWPKFSKRLWQPRYHDRIIRNEKEYWAIRQYIKNNLKNWGKDKENKLLYS
ncbi:MAG: hypothetical protein WCV93_00060 [Candidatus Shapirobacteria bacterium]|jgi:REP element-mobilizing transposase RayT